MRCLFQRRLKRIFFTVEDGDVTGPYRDLQQHLYWVDSEKPDSEKPDSEKPDSATGAAEQWSKDFIGMTEHYAVAADTVLTSARVRTEVPMFAAAQPNQSLHKLNGWEGTYERLSATTHSSRFAFIYSSLQKPAEVYVHVTFTEATSGHALLPSAAAPTVPPAPASAPALPAADSAPT